MTTGITILVVEDSRTQAERLAMALQKHGYAVEIAPNGRKAIEAVHRSKPDVVLSDIVMPEMDGYQMCRIIKEDPELEDIIVILLTHLTDPAYIIRGLNAKADYYLPKPCEEDYLLATVKGALASQVVNLNAAEDELSVTVNGMRHVIDSDRRNVMRLLLSTYENAVQQNRHLVRLQGELTRVNERHEERVRERTNALQLSFRGIIEALSSLSGFQDSYTAGHARNVADLCMKMGQKMGMTADDLMGLWVSAMLYDIGKIVISPSILSKPAPLTPPEWAIIREHPAAAREALSHAVFPWPVAEVVHQHHERLDSSGYPRGLPSDQIHPWAQIIAVADVADAMRSHRPYRPAYPIHTVFEHLERNQGILYRADLVHACLEILAKEGKRTLVLDGDPDSLLAILEALRRQGVDAAGFLDPSEALAVFEKNPSQLVVTELKLPSMSGFEVIERVHGIEPKSKVIVVTRACSKEDAVRAMRLEAVDLLEKPLSDEDLGNALLRAWQAR